MRSRSPLRVARALVFASKDGPVCRLWQRHTSRILVLVGGLLPDLAPCRREQRKTLSSRCAQHRSGVVTQQQRKRRDVLTYMAAPRWAHIRFVRLTSPAEIKAFTGAIEAVHAGARRR